MRCDFHTHSTVSDGSFSPRELMDEAAREGVDLLALTDHDDVSGIAEASERAAELGVELMPGIEISVNDDEGARLMHILGLGIDPGCDALVRRLEETAQARRSRAEKMVEKLQALGVDIRLERVREIAGRGSIGRPHLAQALVDIGVCNDQDEAFARYLRRGKPANVEHPGMTSREAIDLIHTAGGIASLAHPPHSSGVDAPGGLERFIERLVHLGLDGVEVQHPGHRAGLVKRLGRYARAFDLVQTGGSDFHGASRPDVRLGRGRGGIHLGRAACDAIRARIEQRRDNPGVLTPSGPATTLARPS